MISRATNFNCNRYDLFFCSLGYAVTTLYAEAETRLFLSNSSDSSDYLYMEEVRVFLNDNNSKLYFKVDESSRVVEMTRNESEAAFFTLKTTPDLHNSGQFQLVHAPGNVSESITQESSIQDRQLIMRIDTEGPSIPGHGPFIALAYCEECRNNQQRFEIRGMSTTLPELQ